MTAHWWMQAWKTPLKRPLRPRSPTNPGGFAHERTTGLLKGKSLRFDGGGNCQMTMDYRATEAPRIKTIDVIGEGICLFTASGNVHS
jgi:hypothetical protein